MEKIHVRKNPQICDDCVAIAKLQKEYLHIVQKERAKILEDVPFDIFARCFYFVPLYVYHFGEGATFAFWALVLCACLLFLWRFIEEYLIRNKAEIKTIHFYCLSKTCKETAELLSYLSEAKRTEVMRYITTNWHSEFFVDCLCVEGTSPEVLCVSWTDGKKPFSIIEAPVLDVLEEIAGI